MSSLTQSKFQSDQRGFRPKSTDLYRSCPVHILFIHRDADTVECCLQELKKARFVVSADTVLNLAQCTEQLRSQSYDVVVAEYPSPSWKGSQGLQFLRQTVEEVPLLFVSPRPERKEAACGVGRGRKGLAAFAIAVSRAGGQSRLWNIPV